MGTLHTAIVIAWPQCTARADETIAVLLRRAGVVKNLNMRVGHAAICLVEPTTHEILYYDFGRYITPRGFGRARSKYSEPDLALTTKADFDENGDLQNMEDIAAELESKLYFTHGEGPLVFSVTKTLDFNKAKAYADKIVMEGYYPYDGLIRSASNCARYVTEILKAGIVDKRVGDKLKYPYTVRPTPLFNVVAANTYKEIFSYENGVLQRMAKTRRHSIADLGSGLLGSAFTKYSRRKANDKIQGSIDEPDTRPSGVPEDGQWLGGLGEGAWFHAEPIDAYSFKCTKYGKGGLKEYEGVYRNPTITLVGTPKVTYASHYGFVSVDVEGEVFRFYRE